MKLKRKKVPQSSYLEHNEESAALQEPITSHNVQAFNYHRHRRRRRNLGGLFMLVAVISVVFVMYLYWGAGTGQILPGIVAPTPAGPQPGDIIGKDNVRVYNRTETANLARQNYGAATLPVANGITKITFRYRSDLPEGGSATVYARAYIPDNQRKDLPVFAFATGTTGIGDECAPSLEQPAKSNWANYDSHMAMYASQGYAAVVTDYEGMRDPGRIHHYMVGALEGRAVLDSIRALQRLPETKDRLSKDNIFLGGYSQGGHAAFWADKIAPAYAPEIKPKGVIGFGPVISVRQTLADITRGANINWFGPFVLFSYRDYYRTDYGSVLLPARDDVLAADAQSHCIDTVLPHWGHTPTGVYTPEFIQALAAGQLAEAYPILNRDLELNEATGATTPSAKRINEGRHDNVVTPAQQQFVLPALCSASRGPVQLVEYPNATHYNTMVQSLNDTLGWMRALINGEKTPSTCP